jgi:hypothetical protein
MAKKPIDPQLREVFEKLDDDVVTLSWKWQILLGLFGSQDRVDLLTSTASTFFQVVRTTFADDIFLMVSRLTDSPETSGQSNLVITRLVGGVDKEQYPDFYQRLQTLTDDALTACEPFKQHRHKRLAHSDLNAKLQPASNLLPSISTDQITKAIESLQKVLNEFNVHFNDSETSFKVYESGGVKALVTYLQKGLDASKADDEERLRRLGQL